ncbi:MAG: hypothetical protein JWR89_5195 [Tardiphaga sp.]|nr:hypothetical protein [Tardiphaga sp.]
MVTGPAKGLLADQFQLTSIIAAAICACHESTKQPAVERLRTEDANCIAKAVLSALAEAGLTIVSTKND